MRRAPRRRKALLFKDLRKLFTKRESYSQSLDTEPFPCYIVTMKRVNDIIDLTFIVALTVALIAKLLTI